MTDLLPEPEFTHQIEEFQLGKAYDIEYVPCESCN